ncbi:hypothetical protein F5888DRAFT_1904274 [Russula emetica]|nr:hypothetical protein F5888DRAFT_1904274 [Russula emetica]
MSSSPQVPLTTNPIWASALLPTTRSTPSNLASLTAREGHTTTTPTGLTLSPRRRGGPLQRNIPNVLVNGDGARELKTKRPGDEAAPEQAAMGPMNNIRRVTPATPGTSRTRLVKDLTPRPVPGLPRNSTHKLIEVAPPDAPSRLSRCRPPHASRRDKKLLCPAPRPAGERRRMRRTSLRRTEGKREPKTRSDGFRVPRRVHPTSYIPAELDFSVTPEAPHTLPSNFSSPPLSSCLLQSSEYRRFLLASETDSGKSLAYLLPMLHDLKTAEPLPPRRTGPRALVLAPTHELSRQLASFGNALVHHSRLRVQSASRANVANARVSAARMVHAFGGDDTEGESSIRDVNLSEIGWVFVDEADVLLDPDFIDQTLLLLSDIAAARGKPVPGVVRDNRNKSQAPMPFDYPFNLVLTSATILATHLEAYHPKMTRLVSPRLHRLPTRLALEFSPYNSGNRNAEVLAKLKAVWRDNALAGRRRARVVIFANTRARAVEMGTYLSENAVPNIVVTG